MIKIKYEEQQKNKTLKKFLEEEESIDDGTEIIDE